MAAGEEPSEAGGKKEEQPSEVERFFDKEAELLAAYGMRGDIALERGNQGWAFDWQSKRIIYDPNFFQERGYDLKETLFATTHELMAHYGELLRDPELVLKEVNRYSQKEHLHLLHNIFEDVLGNRRIVAELPFLEETREKLYKEKMFPKSDYTENAAHVQFAYGFIREAMVPGESTQLSPEAREALEKLKSFGDGKINILDLVTTPTIEPKDRFQIMRRVVEPIYQELYKKDLDRESQKESANRQNAGSGKSGQKGGGFWKKVFGKKEVNPGEGKEGITKEDIENAKKELEKQYGDYKDSHPEPISAKDEEKIKEAMREIVGQKGGAASMDRAILEQWAREHGLKPEDVLGYRREYKEVAPLVGELRDVFKEIISRRLKERWRIAPQLKKEGEELEESVLAESYAESAAGGEPRAFREIERRRREEEDGYGRLDMTLVADLSGSMEAVKLDLERKSAILFLEALADFEKEIKEAELESGLSLGMEVRSEARAFGNFGDVEIKPLSPVLSEQARIGIWKKLRHADGGTPDYLSLEAILKSITPQYEKELKEKTRRKVVVVLSDGSSEDAERVQKALSALRSKSVVVLGLGMTESGEPILETYRPDAQVIKDIKDLPNAVKKVILKYTQTI